MNLPFAVFPTKISNSVDESWEIKIKIHISPSPPSFPEGMVRNSMPSAVLIHCYRVSGSGKFV